MPDLVARTKSGRTVTCRLNAAPMQDAIAWLNRYERFWSEALSRLADIPGGRRVMSVQTAVKPSLTVKRRLKAPPAKVFAAWTDPEKIKRWMGPGEIKSRASAKPTPRVGGRYRIQMRTPAGEAHDVGGVYREVDRQREARLHLGVESRAAGRAAESLVTVLFKPDGGGTLLTLTHEQFADEGSARPATRRLERRARQAGEARRLSDTTLANRG